LSNHCPLNTLVRRDLRARKLPFSRGIDRTFLLPAIISFLLLVLIESPAYPADVNLRSLPGDYGKEVFRYNARSPNQLFIIGIGHRDALTRSNDDCTPRIQVEIYRVGEWLIRNEGVGLLLPEGFFAESLKRTMGKTVQGASPPPAPAAEDLEYLEQRLSDDSTFVNAEMLLKENFPVFFRQVEERDLYQTVYEEIRLLHGSVANMQGNSMIRSELDYDQKRRVAAMLQKIPGIISEEFLAGHIKNKKALFTIGLSHISDIVRYVENKRITIRFPAITPDKHRDYTDELNLAKEDFGISVLIPKSLVSDHEDMEKNNVKQGLLEASRKNY
jgi:hypothetical protein